MRSLALSTMYRAPRPVEMSLVPQGYDGADDNLQQPVVTHDDEEHEEVKNVVHISILPPDNISLIEPRRMRRARSSFVEGITCCEILPQVYRPGPLRVSLLAQQRH